MIVATHGILANTFLNKYSFLFDGVNERINFGDKFDFGTGDFSISFFAKSVGGGYIFRKQLSSADPGYQVFFGLANGRLNYLMKDALGGGGSAVEFSTTNYNDSTWRGFVLSFTRAGNVDLYVNGTLVASSTISGIAGNLNNAENFYIAFTAVPFSGYVDEFAVWNKALNATGAAATLVSGGKPANLHGHPDRANLVAWIRADTDANPNVADNSGNGNTGTMENMESGDIQTDVP